MSITVGGWIRSLSWGSGIEGFSIRPLVCREWLLKPKTQGYVSQRVCHYTKVVGDLKRQCSRHHEQNILEQISMAEKNKRPAGHYDHLSIGHSTLRFFQRIASMTTP